jgi:hypothetical protein
MTFVIGMQCSDGIVICADSLEDDGITKKTVDKIRIMGNSDWSLAISGSGPGATLDKFGSSLRNKLPLQDPFDQLQIETVIEDLLTEFNSRYVMNQSDAFHVIVGLCTWRGLDRLLYKGSCFFGQSVVLTPIIRECHTGMGNELWRFLADTLYDRRNSVADNTRLAVFATRLACKYASGVDDPIQVISYTFGDGTWRGYTPVELIAIEMDLLPNGFADAIRAYWKRHNPPTKAEQLKRFKSIKTPGDEITVLEGVKLEELYSISGRRRASKIFRRNTDKLQQRANLVAKRYREAHPNA